MVKQSVPVSTERKKFLKQHGVILNEHHKEFDIHYFMSLIDDVCEESTGGMSSGGFGVRSPGGFGGFGGRSPGGFGGFPGCQQVPLRINFDEEVGGKGRRVLKKKISPLSSGMMGTIDVYEEDHSNGDNIGNNNGNNIGNDGNGIGNDGNNIGNDGNDNFDEDTMLQKLTTILEHQMSTDTIDVLTELTKGCSIERQESNSETGKSAGSENGNLKSVKSRKKTLGGGGGKGEIGKRMKSDRPRYIFRNIEPPHKGRVLGVRRPKEQEEAEKRSKEEEEEGEDEVDVGGEEVVSEYRLQVLSKNNIEQFITTSGRLSTVKSPSNRKSGVKSPINNTPSVKSPTNNTVKVKSPTVRSPTTAASRSSVKSSRMSAKISGSSNN